ncbi:MAG: membrane protein insertion efficiency factor YidD [candidate division Zixibacteria bacterium]|nr:membrane protein insertion efficiency factor YidD [candidate division Zixibacteria bacterium]MDH3936394.1 membrane protein insertion efficiency factor YidD [candidate division Zixibacteria bacterium]MDH4033498.1 membrane protein insertion efficiency factor YidD [candidate division Zixibacteria bacterium]
MSSFLILLIDFYRYALAHLFSGGCRFEPSCSRYGQDALRKYGAWKGSIMTIRRVLRCHPWHEAGYDPVE